MVRFPNIDCQGCRFNPDGEVSPKKRRNPGGETASEPRSETRTTGGLKTEHFSEHRDRGKEWEGEEADTQELGETGPDTEELRGD